MNKPAVAPELAVVDAEAKPSITVQMNLQEAEALRAWLLKAQVDGKPSLEAPLVSGVLARLGRTVDDVLAVKNIRRALEQAGIPAADLPDIKVLELGRRISQAASPNARD